jgi:hypothetical protein
MARLPQLLIIAEKFGLKIISIKDLIAYRISKESLIEKAVTTTKENGTYTMLMNYGAYSKYGLPDQVIFEFNTKNYKLPKGITLEFEDESKPLSAAQQLKNKKGRIEISYKNYSVNKGIPAAIFN